MKGLAGTFRKDLISFHWSPTGAQTVKRLVAQQEPHHSCRRQAPVATCGDACTHVDREGAVNKAMQQTMGRLAASVLAAVFLPAGGAGPLAATGPWMTSADRAAAYYGTAVATAGDVNGDGYGDVIVGAPGYNNGAGEAGAVFVYHGSAAGLSTIANWRAVANRANAAFGFSVATAGDVNGDGYDDVLVGAPGPETDEQGIGRVFVYHGSASGLSTAPSAGTGPNPKPDGQIVFAQAGAKFGTAVATAGDVNADGFADILIGAPKYDKGGIHFAPVIFHDRVDGLAALVTMPRYVVGFICTACSTSR